MPITRNVYRQLLHLYYSYLKRIDTRGFLQDHDEPSIGGTADQEVIEGHVVSLDFLQAVEEAYLILEAWNSAGYDDEPKLIAELGAGYGRLAYICHKMMPDCTYVILDLPEALICSQSWLRRVCGTGAVISYSDAARMTAYSRKDLLKARIWTLGAQAIEKLEDVDIFVAADNLSVMSPKAAANYCDHVARIAKVFFSRQYMVRVDGTAYCAQYPDSNSWRNPSDGIPPQLFAFPKEWVELFSREGSLGNLTEAAYRIRR
jgi:putative sugar O-methyltransferase